MKDFDIVHFLPSEEIFEKADFIFNERKNFLTNLIPEADIQHVGSASVPRLVGKLDVDIQIRVDSLVFEKVIEIMKTTFLSKHPELWTDGFAIFKNKEELPIEVDYVVTVIGSKKDDFYRVRDFFISNPEVAKEYNELKKQYEGKPYCEYRNAKAAFIGLPGEVKFLKY